MQVNKVGFFMLSYGLTVVNKFRTVSFDTRFCWTAVSFCTRSEQKPHRTTVAVQYFLSLCYCC